MKSLFIVLLIFSTSKALAGANGAAIGAGAAATEMAVATSGIGGAMMKSNCGTGWGVALCAAGAALVVTAIADATGGSHYHDTGNSLNATNPNDPNTPPGGGGNDTTNPSYAAIAPYVAAAQKIAEANGSTLQDLASQAPSGTGGGGGSGSGLDGLPGLTDEMKAQYMQAGKDAVAKYRVSAVATEGGGGGGGRGAVGSSGPNLDLNAILDKFAPRKPASVAGQGLQRTFNGEPIGIANDNIFAKITRAYQGKISAQTFLPPAKN